MKTLKFSRTTNFTGRNGYFKASGIEVLNVPDKKGEKIMLTPLTSRWQAARCDITIPKEDIPKFISVLWEAINPNYQRINRAGIFLSGDDIERQIKLAEEYDGPDSDLLSCVDGITVWEPLEQSLTISEFFVQIDY